MSKAVAPDKPLICVSVKPAGSVAPFIVMQIPANRTHSVRRLALEDSELNIVGLAGTCSDGAGRRNLIIRGQTGKLKSLEDILGAVSERRFFLVGAG